MGFEGSYGFAIRPVSGAAMNNLSIFESGFVLKKQKKYPGGYLDADRVPSNDFEFAWVGAGAFDVVTTADDVDADGRLSGPFGGGNLT